MSEREILLALEAATRAGCACDCKAPQPACMQTVADELAAFLRTFTDDGKGPWVLPDDGRARGKEKMEDE